MPLPIKHVILDRDGVPAYDDLLAFVSRLHVRTKPAGGVSP